MCLGVLHSMRATFSGARVTEGIGYSTMYRTRCHCRVANRARVIACAMGSFLALIADHHTAEDGLPGEGADPATDDGDEQSSRVR